jgi:hypothetical protein
MSTKKEKATPKKSLQKLGEVHKLKHSPTLNTVIMVEKTIQSMDDSLVKISDLKRALPKQINHNVLKVILEYLEESRKIVYSSKGIVWVYAPSARAQKMLRIAHRWPEDFPDFFQK